MIAERRDVSAELAAIAAGLTLTELRILVLCAGRIQAHERQPDALDPIVYSAVDELKRQLDEASE